MHGNTSGRAIVTGASSGVGAATALALGTAGWDVALVARRAERLDGLAAQLGRNGAHAWPIAADLGNAQEARRVMHEAERELSSIDALVLCHGTNVPRRRLEALTIEDWDEIVATNLSSAFYCLHAVLPGMRARGGGQIVMISSVAGRRPSALSGAAYGASKAGMNALCAVVNEEERANGIRATVIEPGDIDTEIMDKRPEPPPPDARTRMLRPSDIAQMVLDVLTLPNRVLIDEIVVRPAG
jgi:NADP-dependent 3-hydroxy acid dehydrogenase YdfG